MKYLTRITLLTILSMNSYADCAINNETLALHESRFIIDRGLASDMKDYFTGNGYSAEFADGEIKKSDWVGYLFSCQQSFVIVDGAPVELEPELVLSETYRGLYARIAFKRKGPPKQERNITKSAK
jgi:hypothetical protein